MPEAVSSVAQASPAFGELYTHEGACTLAEYYEKTLKKTVPHACADIEPALAILQRIVAERLGDDIAQKVAEDLRAYTLVGTADHVGPVSSPFWLYNALTELVVRPRMGLRTVPILACGNVSMANSSFPRGFLYTQNNSYAHVPLHTLKERHTPTYLQQGYTEKDVARFAHLWQKHIPQTYSPEFVTYLREHTLGTSYATQCTRINYELFRQIAPHVAFVHIEQETVVAELLCTYHLVRHTWIADLLHNEQYAQAYTTHFDGIAGAHDTVRTRGSVLFWRMHEGKRMRILRWSADEHTTEDGVTHTHTHESVLHDIHTRTLIPTMALTFLVLSFYHGISCGGGFSQIAYLPRMGHAFVEWQKQVGVEIPVHTTQNICRGDFAYVGNTPQPQTLLDVLAHYGDALSLHIEHVVHTQTLGETLEHIAPFLPHIPTTHA